MVIPHRLQRRGARVTVVRTGRAGLVVMSPWYHPGTKPSRGQKGKILCNRSPILGTFSAPGFRRIPDHSPRVSPPGARARRIRPAAPAARPIPPDPPSSPQLPIGGLSDDPPIGGLPPLWCSPPRLVHRVPLG